MGDRGGQGVVRFRFEGRELTAPAGATVAAGLLANGVRALRATRAGCRPRGLFCGVGNCFDCLVDVGADAAERACRRALAEGDEVRPSTPHGAPGRAAPGRAAPGPDLGGPDLGGPDAARGPAAPGGPWAVRGPDPFREPEGLHAELAVVGAGPAGMAASLAAADAGCDVVLVDAGASLGGQVYRQSELRPQPPAAAAPTTETVSSRLPPRFHRLITHPRVRRLHGAAVWAAEPLAGDGFRLHVQTRAGQLRLAARAVVVATGAVELTLPFPGWDLPGVVTAGAAQALLKGQGMLIGRRVVVGGSGPFLLPVAAGLAAAGARVVALCEATSAASTSASPPRLAALARHPGKLREASGYLATLLRLRVPLRMGHGVVACHGDGGVEAVTIARLDRAWRPVPGSGRRVEADAVCVGHGFVPDLALLRALGCDDRADPARPTPAAVHDGDLAATRPGVFVAGEVTGIGGADVAELEGRLAGASAARHLGRLDDRAHGRQAAPVRARLARARRFAALLGQLYPIGPAWPAWLAADTVVCRCEETTWAEVERAVSAGADDVRAVRGVTRCGMGYCQGRVCGPPLQLAVAARTGRPLPDVGDFHARTINLPVQLGALAAAPPTANLGDGLESASEQGPGRRG